MQQTNGVEVRVTGYVIVFGALLILTLATVIASRLALPVVPAVILGIAIAAVKAALVAVFFMHLSHERGMVFIALAFTAMFCAALFGLVLWTEADHAPGTQFTSPFESKGAP